MVDVHHGDILIGNGELYIIRREQLIVSHVIRFDPHKCRIMINFGITVSIRPANFYLFNVFSQLSRILPEPFILPLLNGLMFPFSIYKCLFKHCYR